MYLSESGERMITLFSIDSLDLPTILIGAAIFIVVVLLFALIVNKGKYLSRYKRFYKKFDKTITKSYNANLLNEAIVNQYAIDRTNTFKSLKGKGKRKVKKYFEYYVKNLPELVFLKSFTSADKHKNQLVVLLLNEFDKVLYRWDKSKKVKGLIKASNKYQMLTSYIGFFFEVPLHIHEGVPYRFTNHDNDYRITYDVVKNVKRVKSKIKEKKLTKKETKALAKIEAIKAKKDLKFAKHKR